MNMNADIDLYKYMDKNVIIEDIKNFKDDEYELATIRYILKEASKLFYRDNTFFLNKEEIKKRSSIYNKKINPRKADDFSIVCKSYCVIIRDILKNKYDIETELISPFDDELKHIDLLLTTKKGNRYIIDPLMDLEKMQVGLKTDFFASEEKFDMFYVGRLDNISFISDEELKKIDDKIHYTMQGMYMNDAFKMLSEEFSNLEDVLKENDDLAIELLGKKNEGEELSQDRKTEIKLDFLIKYLNNRRYINGVADLHMYTNILLSEVFTQEEKRKIEKYSFFVDDKDIKDDKLRNVLKEEEIRKRGVIFRFKDKNYIFSLKPECYLKVEEKELNELVEKNNIYIRPLYPVRLLRYLREAGANRNIIHHNEFLRLFNIFEKKMIRDGYDLEEMKKYIEIKDNQIITKYDGNVEYQIENGNLVVCDLANKLKITVIYQDEGRNIEHDVSKYEER